MASGVLATVICGRCGRDSRECRCPGTQLMGPVVNPYKAQPTSGPPVGGRPLLYDSTGTPIPNEGPPPNPDSFVMPETITNRWRGYPSRDLSPLKLAEIMDECDAGNPRRLIELEEEVLEKDAKIGSVAGLRMAAVMGVPRDIMPADDSPEAEEIAAAYSDAVDQANFDLMLKNQLFGSTLPHAISHIEWGIRDGWNVPVKFTPLPAKNFMWALGRDQLLYVPDLNKPQMAYALDPYTTVRSIFNLRMDHPTRNGLLRPVMWLYLFKIEALKKWAIWMDRYGTPVRTLKIPDEDFENKKLFTEVRNSLRSLGANASGIFPLSSELEIHGEVTGEPVYKTLIDFCDIAIAQAFLGHELSSQGGRGLSGVYGVSAAKEVREDIVTADCVQVAEDERRDIAIPFTGFNYGWDKIHLAPYRWYKYEAPTDQAQRATTLSVVSRTFPDLAQSKRKIREEFNMPPPEGMEDSDDVIYPAAAPTAPLGLFVGGGGNDPADEGQPRRIAGEEQPAARRVLSGGGQRLLPPPLQKKLAREAKAGTRRGIVLTSGIVQRIANHGIDETVPELAALRAPITEYLKRSAERGATVHETIAGLTKLYPQLNTEKVRTQLWQRLALSRLYGRVRAAGKAR